MMFGFLKKFFKRAELAKCEFCSNTLGDRPGTLLYRVADRDEVQEMKLCGPCGDRLEDGRINIQERDGGQA